VKKAAMNIKVLIVDDSPVMRKAVRQLLSEESGIEIVGEASSLSQMLEMEERFKLVIMDLHLINEGSTLPDGAGSRVVAVPACSNEDGVPKAKDIGASAFLDKMHLHNTLIPKILELREEM
jgi:two-component system chemotaxis response regulator CheB